MKITSVDLETLELEAAQLREEWERGSWLAAGGRETISNPGSVAERCLALIRDIRAAEARLAKRASENDDYRFFLPKP